jgi:hypothetical protein
MNEEPDEFISGELGVGAYGPTILLVLHTSEAAQWLHDLFAGLAFNRERNSIDLGRQRGIELLKIGGLELRVASGRPDRHLIESTPGRFIWSCTPEEWETASLLIEPFMAGQSGHQYLTSDAADAAVVEVSYGGAESRLCRGPDGSFGGADCSGEAGPTSAVSAGPGAGLRRRGLRPARAHVG